MKQSTQAVRVGSARLHLNVAGDIDSDHAIVYLHAGVADARMFSAQMQLKHADYFSVSYDRRGFGKTQSEDERFSHAGDLAAVIQKLRVQKVLLIGCSQGAKIALDYAVGEKDKVAGLILVSAAYSGAPNHPPDVPTMAIADEIDSAEAANDLDLVNQLEARLWLDGPNQTQDRVSGAKRELFLDMNAIALKLEGHLNHELEPAPVLDRLADLSCPVQIIEGGYDLAMVKARHQDLLEKIPQSTKVDFPEAAHLIPLEAPTAFNNCVVSFVRSLTEAG